MWEVILIVFQAVLIIIISIFFLNDSSKNAKQIEHLRLLNNSLIKENDYYREQLAFDEMQNKIIKEYKDLYTIIEKKGDCK